MACYYEARGFSPYYFAHVIFNVVKTPGAFARNLEGFMGDLAAGAWCEPFPRFSNLHRFIEEITDDLIFEPAEEENGPAYFVRFCRHYGVPTPVTDPEDDDHFEVRNSPKYVDALAALGDEVFHIMFHDLVFLTAFNRLVSCYIEGFGDYAAETDPRFTANGRLRRVTVPAWARDAVYYRDRGECRCTAPGF